MHSWTLYIYTSCHHLNHQSNVPFFFFLSWRYIWHILYIHFASDPQEIPWLVSFTLKQKVMICTKNVYDKAIMLRTTKVLPTPNNWDIGRLLQ